MRNASAPAALSAFKRFTSRCNTSNRASASLNSPVSLSRSTQALRPLDLSLAVPQGAIGDTKNSVRDLPCLLSPAGHMLGNAKSADPLVFHQHLPLEPSDRAPP